MGTRKQAARVRRELQAGMREVQRNASTDLWEAGEGPSKTVAITVEPNPAWPPAIQALFVARREAMLDGRCPSCGSRATTGPAVSGSVKSLTFIHEESCDVADDRLFRAVGRWVLGRMN